ncbi:MAG: single-stranded-DNA-specific exonuclease RecJ [Salinisphaera sp.]|jgi:single-stranded-DNA-specific exonuclease|nr:single-stranded-DNA-specific exonuclease RecJ [Salinisphaera sp.]
MCCRPSSLSCSSTWPIIGIEAAPEAVASEEAVEITRIVDRDCAGVDCLSAIADPLLRRIYAGRGVTSAAELEYGLAGLPHYRDLKGIESALDILEAAISGRRQITVVGDFDCDGATSTTLALDALEGFGARVDFFIPDRALHGYGLSPRVVDAMGAPEADAVILTVDNGIASITGVQAAHAAGWRVVVSDHHLPGPALPPADAIVNPNQPGCRFAGKSLAGVGVVFYLMAALRARWLRAYPDAHLLAMNTFLDLVAVGTVADVVPLDHVNRTLVAQGLRRIRAGRVRPGIAALIQIAGREAARLDTDDIGFAVAPRLNAAGRLENMRTGVACLRARDTAVAQQSAEALSAINRQRRTVQARMQTEAERALALLVAGTDEQAGITVYRDDWHEGIVGLIAARLRERSHRPVVAFAPGAHGLLKGSARSIPGLHIRDVLAGMDAEHPGLIDRFGGHAQAAGLSMAADRVGDFSVAFDQAVARRLTESMRAREYQTDGELGDRDHALDVAIRLRDGGPWGAGFEAPLFHGAYRIISQRIVGTGHLKLTVQPIDGASEIEAMVFNCGELLDEAAIYRLVFRLQVNEFRGVQRPNLIVEHLRVEA